MAARVCVVSGCPNLRPCRHHEQPSARNHAGVSPSRRGYGRAYRAARAELLGLPCALRLDGCTGVATTAQHTDAGGLVPSCGHCNFADGARRMRLVAHG